MFLFLTAIFVTCLGIVAGIIVYRQYVTQKFNLMRFHGGCRIPFNTETIDSDAMINANREFLTNMDQDDGWFTSLR